MSSVSATFATTYRLPTKFSPVITPSYFDSMLENGDGDLIKLPIPFTVVNEVLDINVNQSADIQTFVNNGTEPSQIPDVQGKPFGGARLVMSLGANMTTYLRNWINIEESIGSAYAGPLVLYIKPVMTKVQLANPGLDINDNFFFDHGRSWGITTEAPVSTEYTGGGSVNNFYTAWIFKTPMTVQYVAPAGGFKYITFTSQISED
jgi:hypothetical protein